MTCLLLEVVHNVLPPGPSVLTHNEELVPVLGIFGSSGLDVGQVHSVFLTPTEGAEDMNAEPPHKGS